MTKLEQNVGGSDDPYFAGDSLEITITVDDADGNDKDLSGASVSWALAEKPGGAAVLDGSSTGVTVSVTNAATGEVTVTIAGGTTDDLVGSYYHELEVTDSAGDVDTVARGRFDVERDIA